MAGRVWWDYGWVVNVLGVVDAWMHCGRVVPWIIMDGWWNTAGLLWVVSGSFGLSLGQGFMTIYLHTVSMALELLLRFGA